MSIRASSTIRDRERNVVMVELSVNTSRAADMAANGPLVKAIRAIWGMYVKRNMKDVTLRPRVMVRPRREMKGPQRPLWDRK